MSSIKYDLEERTKRNAIAVIHLVRELKVTAVNKRIIEQVVASSGSIAANYCEANEAESKKDFIHKIAIAKKEIKETKLWLDLLVEANPELKKQIELLMKETNELLLIFSRIISTSKQTHL